MLPLLVFIIYPSCWLLIGPSGSMPRLNIIIWHELIWLWGVALILCIVLVDLSLRILWYGSLVGGGGVVVVALACRGVLITVSGFGSTTSP
jgi:hypothetical protein